MVIATLMCVAAGVALYFLMERKGLLRIGIFIAATVLIINPLVYTVGVNIAKADATTFNEYWNGYEAAADFHEVTCTKNGPCVREYACDPYVVPVTKTRSVSDGKGGTRTESYVENETRYESCPYSKQETTYRVHTTLGDSHTIAANVMTGPAWRSGVNIPGGQVTSPPERWLQVKERIDAGRPGPVTEVNTYTNFILASTQTLFKKYEGEIDSLLSVGLLPVPASGVTDLYHAAKGYNVAGALPADKAAGYIEDVSYLGGAVGSDLHGDLHVVFVPNDVMLGPDNYSAALMAYWQSDLLGRNAISKNAIIVVMGVDDNSVTWARAFTGMPVGNEALLMQIQNTLKGESLEKTLLGRPSIDLASETIKHTDGTLESLLWGSNTFERVSMSGDGDESAGFGYLMSDVQVGGWAYVFIAFFNVMFAVGVLVVLARVSLSPSDR